MRDPGWRAAGATEAPWHLVGGRTRRHRLFAIDLDGKNGRFLGITSSKGGFEEWLVQYEDQILHWPLNDPDHGFLLEENRLRFYERLGKFVEKHLAPR